MDFLKNEFLDQLEADIDINGNIIIEGAEFTPQQILQDLDPTIFNELFQQWCENKKQERLDKAEEILNLHDNKSRFAQLKDIYNRGAIIPFIGAGMSISSGYIGWNQLLKKAAQETTLEVELIERHLANYEYEEIAQLIFDNMGEISFNEFLENIYGIDQPVLGAIRYLPCIFPNSPIITTNFDDVIKKCYENTGHYFSETLLGCEAHEIPRFLGQNKNILIKLHGKFSSGRYRVLTKNDYELHYNEKNTLFSCIKAITHKTLLFLGCSLGNDRTISTMKNIIEQEGATAMPRHYAFLKLDADINRIARKTLLATANIFPIWYEGDHDECIAALLEKLHEGIDN